MTKFEALEKAMLLVHTELTIPIDTINTVLISFVGKQT